MTKARFTEEFKQEAIKQVLERGYTVPDVAKRLGVSAQSLYKWIKVCAPDEKERFEAEIREVRTLVLSDQLFGWQGYEN